MYLDDSGKSDEGQGHQSGDDQGDARPFEALREWIVPDLLADAGQSDDGQGPAQPGADAEGQGLQEVVIPDDHEEADAQNGAVNSDQWKENSKRIIQGWEIAVDNHFNQLHESGDNYDEDDEAKVLQAKWHNHQMVDQVIQQGREGKDEGDSLPQIHSGLDFTGYGYEGTHTEEIRKDHVIREDGSEKYNHWMDIDHDPAPPFIASFASTEGNA